MHHSNATPELWPLLFWIGPLASVAHLHARWSAQTQLAANSSGCWMVGRKVSNLDAEPARVRLASADAHPRRSAAWGAIDWEVDYDSFGQVVGRQRDTHHLAAASAKVWGHAFLASVCLDKHHRNNKKTQCCQSPNVGGGFLLLLSQCCWQLSLHLGSCIIRSFILLSKSAKTARLHGWGRRKKKNTGLTGSGGKRGVFDVLVSRRHIAHFDIS